jgi:Flp pilus assembly protein TadD
MQGSPRIDELRQKFHENPRRYFAPLANEYRKAGDPEQAIAICRAHLAQQPGHMSGHVVYGQALYDAHRSEEARVVFEKALSLDPDNAIVLRNLGHIAREKGETTEARHWYNKALDLDPQDSEVAAYVAELTEPVLEESAEGRTEDAEEVTEAGATAGTAGEVAEDAATGDTAAEGAEEVPEAGATADTAVEAEEEVPEAGVPEDTAAEAEEEVPEAGVTADTAAEAAADASAQEAPEPMEVSREGPLETVGEPGDRMVEPEIALEPEVGAAAWSFADPGPHVEPVHADEAPEPAAELFPEQEDVAWRKTPQPEDSPFVTRTMAELYAQQGYRESALAVYRQLAIQHPDDADIRDRIAELSRVPADAPLGEARDETREEAGVEESRAESGQEVRTDSGVPLADDSSADGFADSSPEIPAIDSPVTTAADAVTPTEDIPHFTEIDLGVGDAWDTDPWAAGFSSAEGLDIEFDAADRTAEAESEHPADARREEEHTSEPEPEPIGEQVVEVEPEPGPEPAPEHVAEAEPEPVAEAEPERLAEAEPSIESGDEAITQTEEAPASQVDEELPSTAQFVPTPVALGQIQTSLDEAGTAPASPHDEAVETAAEDSSAAAELETAYEPEDEAGVVAYSPEAPPNDELPHFVPRRPTVREFFATLGAMRPPSDQGERSFTARAAIPAVAAPGASDEPAAEDLPLATDAFSDLFPESTIPEEDTRAAFALSGAMSATQHSPTPASVQTPPPPEQSEPAVEHSKESEDDIRRFREWLDGLAEP